MTDSGEARNSVQTHRVAILIKGFHGTQRCPAQCLAYCAECRAAAHATVLFGYTVEVKEAL